MTALRRKQRLSERQALRSANRRQRQEAMWAARFDAAENPLDLLGLAYSLLRGRLVQFEERAAAAIERDGTNATKTGSEARLAAARAVVERVCGEVAEHLANVADQFDTTRK